MVSQGLPKSSSSSDSEGVIFEIERWSVNDGPGIRTVVFLKGCPLNCSWCCNPESWSPIPQIACFEDRCQNCGRCQDVCPQGIAQPANLGLDTPDSGCIACGQCVAVCPYNARELLGTKMSTEEILSSVEEDRVFYRQSGGGITFSGGEALAQLDFLREIVERCWAMGLSMVLETSGHFAWAKSKDILTKMEMIFLDIKHMDPVTHKKVTGADNRIILQNARNIANEQIPLAIRIPLIPTINDDVENLVATATFISEQLQGALGVEILPYHTLGKGKYELIGLRYQLDQLLPPSAENVAEARGIFTDFGIEILHFGSSP